MLLPNTVFYHVCQEALVRGIRTHARIFRTHLTQAPHTPPPVKLINCRRVCHPLPLEFSTPLFFDTGPAPTPFVA